MPLLKLVYKIRNLLLTEIQNNQRKKGVKENSIKLHKKILKAIMDKNKDQALIALNEHFDSMDSLFKIEKRKI